MEINLTNKQRRFCEEYVIDLNATQAAIRAGYREKTARFIGSENLSKPNIKNCIEKLQADISKRNRITIDYLVTEFHAIEKDSINNYVDFKKVRNGVKMILKKDYAEMDTRNIQQLNMYPGGSIKSIKLYARDNALEQLGRHIGFFNDQLTVKNNLEDVLKGLSDGDKLSEDHLRRLAELIFEHQKKFLKA